MLNRLMKHKVKEAEQNAELPAGGGGESPSPEPEKKDWSNDPRVDANGNPIEQPTPEQPEAPVETPTEPEAPEKDQQEKPEERKYELDTPVVQQVENLIKETGLTPKEVRAAIEGNDGKVTPELLKALVDKNGELVGKLVADKLEGFHKEAQEKLQSQQSQVYTQVEEAFKDMTNQDGQKTWNELASWAKTNVPNEERNEINQLLAKGGISAKLAVQELVNRFKSSDTYTQPAKLVDGDSASNSGGVVPMSKTEYTAELRKLEAKGHVYGQSQEMAKLDARRLAGMKRGI